MGFLVLIVIIVVIVIFASKGKNNGSEGNKSSDGRVQENTVFSLPDYRGLAIFKDGEIYLIRENSKELSGKYSLTPNSSGFYEVQNDRDEPIGFVSFGKDDGPDETYGSMFVRNNNVPSDAPYDRRQRIIGHIDYVQICDYENGEMTEQKAVACYLTASDSKPNKLTTVGAGAAYIVLVFKQAVPSSNCRFF